MVKSVRANSRPFWFWAIPVNIVVIALIAIFVLVIDEDDQPAPVAEQTQPAGQGGNADPGAGASGAADSGSAAETPGGAPGEARRDAEDPFGLGNPESPVAMVVFTDFQCPYCAKHSADVEPKLIDQYLNEVTLRIEWRDVDFFGDDSNRAARAAWAAGQQNQYIEYHQSLFADGEPLDPADLTQEKLTAAAQSLSMDIEQFERDMEADAAYQHVRDNAEEAAAVGAFSTPAFVINGQPMSGAQPLAEFQKAIEAAEKDNPYEGSASAGSGGGSS